MLVLLIGSVCLALATAKTTPAPAPANPIYDFNKHFAPEQLDVCYQNENINDCIKHDLEIILPKIAKGLPQIGLPPMDPNVEPEIRFEYENDQVMGKAVFKNVHTYGLSQAQILDVRSVLSDDKIHFEVDFNVPKVVVEGTYKGEGRINSLLMSAKGNFNVSMVGVSGTWLLDAEEELVDGVRFMRVTRLTMRPVVQDMKIYFSEIFPGNDDLNKLALDFLNDNWRFIYRETLPYAEQYFNLLMTKHANKLFLNVPFDIIFPRE